MLQKQVERLQRTVKTNRHTASPAPPSLFLKEEGGEEGGGGRGKRGELGSRDELAGEVLCVYHPPVLYG